MKKELLALACVAAVGMTASATDYKDVLTLDEAQFAAMMAGQEINGYFDAGRPDFTWDGPESGVEYRIGYIVDDEDGGMQFYYGGFIASLSNPDGLYLKSVRIVGADGTVYGRTTPVGYHMDGDNESPDVGYNYDTWMPYPGNTQLDYDYSNPGLYTAEEPFENLVIMPNSGTSYNIEAIEITWTNEAIVPQVKTPSVRISYDYYTGALPSGSLVEMSDATDGCTIHYTVSINGGEAEEFTGEEGSNYTTYEMVGEPGTEFAFVCWAVKDGYTDSEKMSGSATLTLPGLEAPAGDIGEYAWFDCILGRTGKIRNPNGFGTLVYSINGGEEQETEESSVEYTVAGEIGSMFTLSAYVKCEGYQDSQVSILEKEILDNRLNAPYFDPADGSELRPGQAVRIYSNQNWMGKGYNYRVNGGEWIYVEGSDVEFVPEGPCTVEAQYLADPEGSYSYYVDSPISTASFTIENITENMYVITPEDFGFTGNWVADHTPMTALINGVTFDAISGFNNRGYFDWGGGSDYKDHITNIDPIEKGIQRVKTEDNYSSMMVIFFSDSPLIDSDMNLYKNEGMDESCAVIVNYYDNKKWIDLKEYDAENGTETAGKTYMLVRPYNNESWGAQLTRMILDTDVNTAVEGVDAVTGMADGIYSLNGLAVKGDNLAKGIYIKVADGKASKMIVK